MANRPPLQKDQSRIDRVLGIREANNPRAAQTTSPDGSQFWAASGLRGFQPGLQGNFWQAAGFKDPWSVLSENGKPRLEDAIPQLAKKYNERSYRS